MRGTSYDPQGEGRDPAVTGQRGDGARTLRGDTTQWVANRSLPSDDWWQRADQHMGIGPSGDYTHAVAAGVTVRSGRKHHERELDKSYRVTAVILATAVFFTWVIVWVVR